MSVVKLTPRKVALWWTDFERSMLLMAARVLSARTGGDHEAVFYETDIGEPVCSYTVGYHCDATLTISKNNIREYVATRWDGKLIVRCESIVELLEKHLNAKSEDVAMASINEKYSKVFAMKGA